MPLDEQCHRRRTAVRRDIGSRARAPGVTQVSLRALGRKKVLWEWRDAREYVGRAPTHQRGAHASAPTDGRPPQMILAELAGARTS